MPTINKQTMKKPLPVPTRNGSVLASAIPVNKLVDEYIKIVIYGQNRTGKTTLACQFPKPLLLIAFEPARSGGARSVKRVPGVDYIKITSTTQAKQLATELINDRKYKTHVLDTVTSYQDIVLQEILDLPEAIEQLSWGMVTRDQYRERSEKTRELLRPFLNLNAHTVLCAKEKDHNPPDREKPKILRGLADESFFATDLGGATVGWLHDACDYITRLYLEKEVKVEITKTVINKKVRENRREVETGRIVRRLRTLLHPNYAAGFRSERPETIPEFIEDPTFDKIYDLIRGE